MMERRPVPATNEARDARLSGVAVAFGTMRPFRRLVIEKRNRSVLGAPVALALRAVATRSSRTLS